VYVTLIASLGAGLGAGLGACRKTGDTKGASTDTAGGSAASKPPAPPPAATPASAASKPPAIAVRPLLWSAEKDGKTTYFLGTMHAGIDAETQLPPMVWTKLAEAKAFAMETDIDDPSVVSLIKPTGSSLRDQLGAAYWKKLEDALGPAMAGVIDHLPPMVPATALAIRGLPPTPPMDKVLAARATRDHKPTVFLEPVARQIELLGKWMDIKALKMLLDELAESEQRSKAMLNAYVVGDELKILALNDSEKADALRHGYTAAEYDQEMEDLLYGRNASWIEALERLHSGGGGFVAVGAMHLIGPRGVLDLLARKGYRVTRVDQ